jgi:hypothetical protein
MSKNKNQLIAEGITFGPFRTWHHRRTTGRVFQASFLQFVIDNIASRVTIDYVKVEGHVTTDYDDKKFFGPNSVVKYRYNFRCDFVSGELKETASAQVDFDPVTSTFTRARWPTKVSTIADQEEMKRLEAQHCDILRQLIARINAGDKDIACPQCGAIMSVRWISKDGKPFLKDIECPTKACWFVHYD